MRRLLAVVIAGLLAGAIAAAIVKDDGTQPLVVGTPTPTQTYTFPGVPPTTAAEPSETPIIPETETPEPSPSSTRLAGTGTRSAAGPAFVVLLIALAGGIAVVRASRGPA